MPEDDTPPPAAPMPPYWALAIAYALLYGVLSFAVEWIWDTVAGDSFDVGATAQKCVLVAVPFGLAMAWLVPRMRRAR